eukprot:GHVN01045001.1.p1 GENE.GHVN01045001.1~~GHVN01045001.1.p1  ORF type:complete len:109 (-),score=16.84 GHVN01045001.1:226-552(-)
MKLRMNQPGKEKKLHLLEKGYPRSAIGEKRMDQPKEDIVNDPVSQPLSKLSGSRLEVLRDQSRTHFVDRFLLGSVTLRLTQSTTHSPYRSIFFFIFASVGAAIHDSFQ